MRVGRKEEGRLGERDTWEGREEGEKEGEGEKESARGKRERREEGCTIIKVELRGNDR